MSGSRRLVLLTLLGGPGVGSDGDGVLCGAAAGGAAVELLDGPDVWSGGSKPVFGWLRRRGRNWLLNFNIWNIIGGCVS